LGRRRKEKVLKLVLISDTHGKHDQVVLPEGDVLIHAGDFCMGDRRGKIKELSSFATWFAKQPHRHKIVIAGNHDWATEAFMKEEAEWILRKDFFSTAHYLRDSEVTINGVKFYGSPWQPTFYDWAFNADRGPDIKTRWDKIPQDTKVLITHGPPMGILDRVWNDIVGCADLTNAVARIKPKVHVFGHIHCGYGFKLFNGTQFYNAALCDEAYNLRNKPWEVNL
jgi:Icc-related predicted phosphoesterase